MEIFFPFRLLPSERWYDWWKQKEGGGRDRKRKGRGKKRRGRREGEEGRRRGGEGAGGKSLPNHKIRRGFVFVDIGHGP
jgi:hypothetical protein